MPIPEARIRSQRGFTLVEILITVCILGLIVLIGMPSFLGTLNRTRLTGASRQIATLFQAARLEAIKKNSPVKVEFDSTIRRFYAFLDSDRDGVEDAGEHRLSMVYDLPVRVQLRGPGESAQYGAESIDGWDDAPVLDGPSFQFDGSVDRVGAFRVGDAGDNIIEVRVEPAATGHIVIRKWDRDDDKYYGSHEANKAWPWY